MPVCWFCGEKISTKNIICPNCGRKQEPIVNQEIISEFVANVVKNNASSILINISEFNNIFSSIIEEIRKVRTTQKNLPLIYSCLSSICPICEWKIIGKDLFKIHNIFITGIENTMVIGPGYSIRFNKGICPNEKCSSNNIILEWKSSI